jgi:hypothetical protein
MLLRVLHTVLLIYTADLFHTAGARDFNPHYHFKHLHVENGLTDNILYHFLHYNLIPSPG